MEALQRFVITFSTKVPDEVAMRLMCENDSLKQCGFGVVWYRRIFRDVIVYILLHYTLSRRERNKIK